MRGERKRTLVIAGILGVALRAAALGQSGPDNDPDAAPGYVDSVFHHGQVDSINLYNGQLTIPVALGPSYPVGPNLKYQAMLTYSSRSTDYGHPNIQPPDYVYTPFAGNPALGQGWEFTLGAIKFCKQGNTIGVCYFGPDGSQHIFSQGTKTGDGSQLLLSGSGPYEMWDGDGNHYVFGWQVTGLDDFPAVSPAGYVHDFGMGRDGWYLTSVADPFGNSYSVRYHTVVPPCWRYGTASGGPCTQGPAMTCPTSPIPTWIPQAVLLPTATVQILLATQGATPNMISGFVFPVSRGGSSTWSLGYEQFWDNFHTCSSNSIHLPVEVHRITRIQLPVDLPGSPAYEFSYACPLTMTLPTGAAISYTFGFYTFYHGRAGAVVPNCQGMTPQNVPYVDVSFPMPNCPFSSSPAVGTPPAAPASFIGALCTAENESRWRDVTTGVVRRTETVPGAGSSPAIIATTDYTQYSFPYGEQGSSVGKQESQTLTVVLFPPDSGGRRRAKGVLFRSTPKGSGPSTTLANAPGDRVGADLEERIFDGDPNNTVIGIGTGSPACGGGADQPFCSSRAVRVTRRTYEYDDCNADGLAGSTICHEVGNRRLKTETTCYGATSSAGSCLTGLWHAVRNTNLAGKDWDSANGRHYNSEEHSGTLGNDVRTVTTRWTPSVSPWLPNLYEGRTDALGSSVQDRYFEFDRASGFPRGEALYDGTRQIVFLTCRYNDGSGSVGKDFSATYPGQSQPPPANACSLLYPGYPSVAIGVNGDAFGKTYTHRNGLLLTAQWMKDPATPAPWFVKNLLRDSTTGWILASSDSSGVTTAYDYDSLGRVRTISPTAEAATDVSYDSPIQTTVTRDGGHGLSTLERYLYDGEGRLGRVIRQMPSSSAAPYAIRMTGYDAAGHASSESEWSGCGGLDACASSSGTSSTTTSSFDPTGRPQTIRRADGATTTISYADGSSLFSPTQRSVTTDNINGVCSAGCSGGASSTTTFRYDAFGRLVRVIEPGADTTDYAYDVNGKLMGVTQGVQTRSFAYDSAGNLRDEITPEKGEVRYGDYGSLGNLLSQTEPGNLVVTRSYDFAGRLTGVFSGGQRYLAHCYDGGPCPDGSGGYSGGRYPLGKLTRRIGFNPLSPSSPMVTDDMGYSDGGGRLSLQTTAIAGSATLTTTQKWEYNALGSVAHHHHPRPDGAAPFAVSIDYDAGLPVTEYVNGIPMVTSVRYQPAGSLASYTTGIGIGHDVTTTIAQDPALLPRPSSISTAGAASNFATGTYSYDGAGNITAMGADAFSYDLRSRILSASLSGVGSQAYSYDRYGNLLTKGGNTFCSGSCTNNHIPGASYVRGNLTGFAGQAFSYDGLDRMASNASSSLTWSYLYDGGDERIGKIPPSGDWQFTIRDEGKRVVSEFAATTPSRDNVFLGSQLVLAYADARVGVSGPVWTYYASDHLGTPRLVTDAAGTTVETRRYWPYGDAVSTQSSFEPLRFASMEFDPEGGTAGGLASDRYYDHARSHVGGLGRFLTPDVVQGKPDDPGSWNRYAYSRNGPLTHFDPDGRQSCDLGVRDPNTLYLRGSLSIQELRARPAELAPLGVAMAVGALGFFAPEIAGVAARAIPVISPLAGRLAGLLDARPIVLGETMRDRVDKVVSAMQAGSFGTTSRHLAQMLAENVRWLQGQIDKGVRIFDIGIDPARPGGRSLFYGAEVGLLLRNGFTQVYSHLVRIGDKTYKVYEWVRKAAAPTE